MSRWLAYPQALTLLLALPLLANLALLALLARRRGWRLLGSWPALAALSSRLPRRRLVRGLLIAVGLLFVGVAAAGPQWGREPAAVSSAARDLVVVLDVSRSMLAETPSRQLRAQRVLADLATTLKERGGHRIALVVGAAKAQLVVPLTTDYDLFAAAVWQQDAARLPAELRPGADAVSGTRLGEAIQQAIAAHESDAKYRSSQVILLISDGDDPAEDGEWKTGATAAHRVGIPVFTVGVGDPDRPSKIRVGDTLLTFDGQPVETKLHEDVLKEIARRTDATYFPVRTETVVPGTLFPAILEAAAARPREAPVLNVWRQRYRWFLAVGLAGLAGSLLVGDRRGVKEVNAVPRVAPLAVALALVAVVLAGAAPQVEDPLRLGNDAFLQKDYETALKHYGKAESHAADPGLVAFNKGATLFRLGRYREAELCYLRCLQDRDCPGERRLKALYDLGTALLQHGGDARDADALLRAGESFELCVQEATEKTLRDDAEYNLELARLLWAKVRRETKGDDKKNPNEGDSKPKTDDGKSPKGADSASKDIDGQGGKTKANDPKAVESPKKMPGGANVLAVPDSDKLQPMDGSDARDLLARAIERIERERNQALGQHQGENGNVKDW